MAIFRIHAYSVEPSRTTKKTPEPQGGSIRLTSKLVESLETNIEKSRFDKQTLIAFQFDTKIRKNEIRDLLLDYAFNDGSKATTTALSLSSRLSNAMDLRSEPALFVVAASQKDSFRSIFLWIFPRDVAFHFQRRASGPSIDILTDIFSQTSRLRKAARFEGRNLRNEFIEGRALDFEARKKAKSVADFWIKKFLTCNFSLGGDSGTRLIAKAFRASFDSTVEPGEKEKLFEAMMTLRHTSQTTWSPQEVADHYLTGISKDAFLSYFPDSNTSHASFDFQPDLFNEILKFRVFQLNTGVFVYSPLMEIGESVKIDDPERNLTCKGKIIDESVRTRNA